MKKVKLWIVLFRKRLSYNCDGARYENLFAHTVAVIRLIYPSKKNNPLLIFTFYELFCLGV